jgi:hypothetical protein
MESENEFDKELQELEEKESRYFEYTLRVIFTLGVVLAIIAVYLRI